MKNSEAKRWSKERNFYLKTIYLLVSLVAVAFTFFLLIQDEKFTCSRSRFWTKYRIFTKLLKPSLSRNSSDLLQATACHVPVKNGPVINVGNNQTYVIGSYMDHRLKLIKIIAVSARHQQTLHTCVMCCQDRLDFSPATCSVHTDHFGYDYGTASITCQTTETCQAPTHVSIVTDQLSDVHYFQPIRNRDTQTSFTYNFTVCISVMFHYSQALNLVQALEMFQLLGVRRVVIYKTSCDPDVQKLLDYYVSRGLVELIPWTIREQVKVSSGWRVQQSPGQLHYHGQIPALNDCVYRYMYQSRYVALQDLDELIVPSALKTWPEMLERLEAFYGTTVGFEFENNVFPFHAAPRSDHDPVAWRSVRGTNILKYVERIPNDEEQFNPYKVIVNPRLVQKATVHGLLETIYTYQSTVRVNKDFGQMFHFKNCPDCSRDKALVEDQRLWDYASELIPAVSRVLRDCGLLKD